jgi:hydroxymethylpyrimidine/phosphomethylpyrimidine kinase
MKTPKRFKFEFKNNTAAESFAKTIREAGSSDVVVKGDTVHWTEHTYD